MNPARNKVVTLEGAAEAAETARREGKRVVFTNGCYDLLHAGHVHCLQAAREAGDFLIVGLNTDQSVRRLKGEDRPIFPESERAELVAGMEAVDQVFLFDEDTPLAAILRIRPDRLVKGGDWKPEDVVGRKEVESWGGAVVTIPLMSGRSATSLLEEIRRKLGRG